MTADPIPEGPWRTGRSWGRTIVIQAGPEPGSHGQDFLIGYAKGPDARRNAQAACDAVNEGRRVPGGRWYSLGCLVYDHPPPPDVAPHLVSAWIIATDGEDPAARIADAANGQVTGA